RRYLLTVPRVLVAYDNDADGEKWAPRLVASSARMRQIHVPYGNDITEFWQQDGDVLEWLLAEAGTHYTLPKEVA
ncbi:MAG TPA: hypothetical protein VGW38_12510, partial [Chloroflexota bacterium]|nr:hypothetical protein [Chloroflexota bacterium]